MSWKHYARELAAIAEADAKAIERVNRNGTQSLKTMFQDGSDPNPLVASAIHEREQLCSRPLSEVSRLRALAKRIRSEAYSQNRTR